MRLTRAVTPLLADTDTRGTADRNAVPAKCFAVRYAVFA
jgi:hypothetical protein